MNPPLNHSLPLVDLAGLQAAIERFTHERDWAQFHSPKNLAMALTGEVGELVELFQWVSEADSHKVAADARTARAVRDELADVMFYLVRLAAVLGVDWNEALASKLAANAVKYPVEAARGRPAKYTEF
jgi:NTP pyrophosphatase (non-canonical NTP hydrolase)